MVLQYWKLKRISNGGLPLIRIISSASLERLKLQQHAGILRFRVDLERIRNLSYMLCRREKIKRSWLKTHQSTIEASMVFATGQPLPQLDDDTDTSRSHFKEIKSTAPFEDRLKVASEIINTSVIYDEQNEELKDKPKQLLKKLRAMTRSDPSERWKRLRPNPYAKFYLQRRKELEEKASKNPPNGSYKSSNNKVSLNGYPVSPSHLPLRNKAVPANQSSKTLEAEAVLKEKSVTKTNQLHVKNDEIIKEEPTHFPVITRASALLGYKIPKKKHSVSSGEILSHKFIIVTLIVNLKFFFRIRPLASFGT